MSDLTRPTPEELGEKFAQDYMGGTAGSLLARDVADLLKPYKERLELCEALIDWLLANPWCRPIETNAGTWIVQKYVGHTLARANTKREVVDAARAALEGK